MYDHAEAMHNSKQGRPVAIDATLTKLPTTTYEALSRQNWVKSSIPPHDLCLSSLCERPSLLFQDSVFTRILPHVPCILFALNLAAIVFAAASGSRSCEERTMMKYQLQTAN